MAKQQHAFPATFPLTLGTGAPFTAVGSVGGSKDAEDLSSRYNTIAASLWDRLINIRVCTR